MAILLVSISMDPQRGGGTAERTRRLALNLAAIGSPCQVATMEGGVYADELRAAGIPVLVTGYVKLKFHLPLINPFALLRVVRAARTVHVLGYWNLLSVATSWLARASGRPYVLSAAGEFAALDHPRPVSRLFHRLFGRAMLTNAASLIAITALERNQIIDRFGVPADRVVVIPNGVAIPPQSPPVARTDGEKVLLFVGRLAPIKGPDLLLEAFALSADRLADLRLILAGPDFGSREQLKRRIDELGLGKRVELIGFVDERARTDLFGRALLVTVPSRAEAMSLVALEAGAAGLPVLLTDQCGFDDVANIGGGAVVAATAEALAEGLVQLLTDRSALPAMGQRLRDHVARRYAWPAVAAELRDHLAMLARPATRRTP
ncbi:MAG: glycosyltransferase [Rhizobiales bacterium]|nr:glycosyltransferase [Hyphomicrobiales bacterium]